MNGLLTAARDGGYAHGLLVGMLVGGAIGSILSAVVVSWWGITGAPDPDDRRDPTWAQLHIVPCTQPDAPGEHARIRSTLTISTGARSMNTENHTGGIHHPGTGSDTGASGAGSQPTNPPQATPQADTTDQGAETGQSSPSTPPATSTPAPSTSPALTD